MFVFCLALVHRRVSKHHVPQDEHATRHATPRLFARLCTSSEERGEGGEGGLKGQVRHSFIQVQSGRWYLRCSDR